MISEVPPDPIKAVLKLVMLAVTECLLQYSNLRSVSHGHVAVWVEAEARVRGRLHHGCGHN